MSLIHSQTSSDKILLNSAPIFYLLATAMLHILLTSSINRYRR
jgi:hypothetical protein